MGRTIKAFVFPVLCIVIVITIIRGLHFVLPMRDLDDAEINTGTHDIGRLPLRAAPWGRSSCSIVHTGIFIVIDDMSELPFKYLRSSFHYIWILLQRRAGLGYGSTLVLYSSSVNLTAQHSWWRCRQTDHFHELGDIAIHRSCRG